MDPPLKRYDRGWALFLLLGSIYPTEAVNDQAITNVTDPSHAKCDGFDAGR